MHSWKRFLITRYRSIFGLYTHKNSTSGKIIVFLELVMLQTLLYEPLPEVGQQVPHTRDHRVNLVFGLSGGDRACAVDLGGWSAAGRRAG